MPTALASLSACRARSLDGRTEGRMDGSGVSGALRHAKVIVTFVFFALCASSDSIVGGWCPSRPQPPPPSPSEGCPAASLLASHLTRHPLCLSHKVSRSAAIRFCTCPVDQRSHRVSSHLLQQDSNHISVVEEQISYNVF